MGIGNTLPFSWGKQLLPSFISRFLHKTHESVRTNEWTERRLKQWFLLPLLSLSPICTELFWVITRMRYHNPLGSKFVQFFICFSEEWEGSRGIRQQISFIVSISHVREMLAQLREIFSWLKTRRQNNKILTGSTASDNHWWTSTTGSDALNIQVPQ